KKWPKQELAGFVAVETANRKKLLPVWHNVSVEDVASFSPILADRKAADTRHGLQHVAEQLVAASYLAHVKDLPYPASRTQRSHRPPLREELCVSSCKECRQQMTFIYILPVTRSYFRACLDIPRN